MELSEILINAYEFLDSANLKFELNDNDLCVSNLAKLRELLNDQPELEACGACESAESSDISEANARRASAADRLP